MPGSEIVWQPSSELLQTSTIGRFAAFLKQNGGPAFAGYEDMWHWSVSQPQDFWQALWTFFDIRTSSPVEQVLGGTAMIDAKWFVGARLNYAEHALRHEIEGSAIVGVSETREDVTWSITDLRDQVARCRMGLQRLGVGRGDRVVAYMPNIPETVAAFLAAASLGAIWASCPPEFGARSVIDRFSQIEPKVLLAVDGYRYGGRAIMVRDQVAQVAAALPTLQATVLLPYLDAEGEERDGEVPWCDFTAEAGLLTFEQVAFDHPLYVVYSSGTTGLPKAIVHGHGGILVEHLKNLGLHLDIRSGDRFFWFTTTGWMMWNLLISGLTCGAGIVTFDGNLGWPDLGLLWRLAAAQKVTSFGVSASFLLACQNAGIEPETFGPYPKLRAVGSTGSPLAPATARWFYRHMPANIQLASGSGGTDICSGFVGGVPLKPIQADRIACRYLGAKVEAFDDSGASVLDAVGELVITQPLPSMPVGFWNDPDRSRYREAYYDYFPGIWRHGDWISIGEDGSCVIHGRSDATLNRGGVRLGTAEFYAVIDMHPLVSDSLVVHLDDPGGGMGELILFVVARDTACDTATMTDALRAAIRKDLSPRHLPDTLVIVPAIPRTLSGKKLELPIKRILRGAAPETVVSAGSLLDPSALDAFLQFRGERQN